jgi:hypothetical protein
VGRNWIVAGPKDNRRSAKLCCSDCPIAKWCERRTAWNSMNTIRMSWTVGRRDYWIRGSLTVNRRCYWHQKNESCEYSKGKENRTRFNFHCLGKSSRSCLNKTYNCIHSRVLNCVEDSSRTALLFQERRSITLRFAVRTIFFQGLFYVAQQDLILAGEPVGLLDSSAGSF